VAQMKIVFLHGINNTDPDGNWITGLNRGLVQAGFEPVTTEDTVAPKYGDLLDGAETQREWPPETYKVGDDRIARRDFERRQARVERILGRNPGVRTHGFNQVPGPVLKTGQEAGINYLSILRQVRNYVENRKLRGAIMSRILDELGGMKGNIVLIGYSLGSVIAIDLLDHLPPDLHVRRFITIGSPAHCQALHAGSERLLKKFPYAYVDDWSNFVETRDPVTGGRGLASVFPAAQDFFIELGWTHDADKYLGHEAVAGLIADVIYRPERAAPAAGSELVGRLDEPEALALLSLQFGRRVSTRISDKDVARRYEDVLGLIQEDLVAKVRHMADEGKALAPELRDLMDGQFPQLPHRWEEHEAARHLAVLATSNSVAPYEINTDGAELEALPEIAVDLGFTRRLGDRVRESVTKINDELVEKRGIIDRFGKSTQGRLMLAAAGIALVAAAPIGLMVAAPAGVAGAAALTGGLAALGPGGMVGGLATLGGLASTGTLMATVAATVGSPDQIGRDPRILLSRIAGEYALKLLGIPHDETLWLQVTEFETQICGEYNRLEPFSDKDAARLADLTAAKKILAKMIEFMSTNGLGPQAL
jgi:pimeloyl-ACP methyl ester carboxylesterase